MVNICALKMEIFVICLHGNVYRVACLAICFQFLFDFAGGRFQFMSNKMHNIEGFRKHSPRIRIKIAQAVTLNVPKVKTMKEFRIRSDSEKLEHSISAETSRSVANIVVDPPFGGSQLHLI